MFIIIPARKGSKGFPFKNRILCEKTFVSIPHEFKGSVNVSTDDDSIKEIASNNYGFNVIHRPDGLSTDHSSIKDVLMHAIKECDIKDDEIILMLYLTYPDRRWFLIEKAMEYFKTKKAKSMLCKMKVLTDPYLCIDKNGNKVIDHCLYRRQDYPEVYEMSHCIFMAYAGEIKNLDNNLYGCNTEFFKIDRTTDVDYFGDML